MAETFLRGRGLRTVTRNFRCRLGEIDLVMRDADCLVFTEVRYRRDRQYGSGAESVTTHKQRRIILTAMWYLKMHGGSRPPRCRFDVVSLGHANGKLEIDWIPNAFDYAN